MCVGDGLEVTSQKAWWVLVCSTLSRRRAPVWGLLWARSSRGLVLLPDAGRSGCLLPERWGDRVLWESVFSQLAAFARRRPWAQPENVRPLASCFPLGGTTTLLGCDSDLNLSHP